MEGKKHRNLISQEDDYLGKSSEGINTLKDAVNATQKAEIINKHKDNVTIDDCLTKCQCLTIYSIVIVFVFVISAYSIGLVFFPESKFLDKIESSAENWLYRFAFVAMGFIIKGIYHTRQTISPKR